MNAGSESVSTDVAIVGAGPVGLALALELGLRGVRCELLERRTAGSPHPRAKLSNVRTMTLLRRWGLADRVRDAAPLPRGFPSDIAFITRWTGWELARFANALMTAPDPALPAPESAQQVPQNVLEDVMRERVESLPSVALRRGVALESFEQDASGVDVRAVDGASGRPVRLRARFLAACDGGRSLVRQALGIPMEGDEALAHNLGAVIRAPGVWSLSDKAPAVQYWTLSRDAPGIIGPLDGQDLWWLHANEVPWGRSVDNAAVRDMFVRAVGTEVECEVLAHAPWLAQRLLAQRYRDGRAFLLGDAAHLHPPMGGYGMNMGIGDAVDLGWKLAAALGGWGGAGLLDSYQRERRPIHQRVIEEAAGNYGSNAARLLEPGLEAGNSHGAALREKVGARIRSQKAREFASLGVQLGYRYEDSPIVWPDGSPEPPNPVSDYAPVARPGHLFPHYWLEDGRAVYDLLGPDFTLLCESGRSGHVEPVVRAARRVGMPLEVRDIDRLEERFGSSFVLVRPDQHVAWRGEGAPERPRALIDVLRGAPSTETERPRAGADATSGSRSGV